MLLSSSSFSLPARCVYVLIWSHWTFRSGKPSRKLFELSRALTCQKMNKLEGLYCILPVLRSQSKTPDRLWLPLTRAEEMKRDRWWHRAAPRHNIGRPFSVPRATGFSVSSHCFMQVLRGPSTATDGSYRCHQGTIFWCRMKVFFLRCSCRFRWCLVLN